MKKYHMWIQNKEHIDGLCYLTEEKILKIIKDQITKYDKVIINIEKQPEENRKEK